jgi:hypothetical protein
MGHSSGGRPGYSVHGEERLASGPSLWEINSIGEIVHEHQRMLIAVLSDDNATEASGITVVQTVAAAAAEAVAGS